MIKWENIEWRFGSWAKNIKPFWKGGGFDKIYEFLRGESGKVAPNSDDTYKCFIKTPKEKTRMVILGLCPYHTEGVADGLALSCSRTGMLQPSLEKMYEAIEEEYKDGLCLECKKDADLLFLAEQGVLLLNAALTVRVGNAKSHNKIWEPFTNHIMSVVGGMNIPVIFLGNEASLFGHHIPEERNKFFLKHPAYASYKKIKWDSEGTFKAVNKILEEKGQEIDWLDRMPF